MADTRHLWRRHNRFFLRLTIPSELRQHFRSASGKPKDKIVESLNTGDLRQAQMLRNARVAYFDAVFARIRAGTTLSVAEIKEESQRAYDRTVAGLKEGPPVDQQIELAAMQIWEDREIERGVGSDIAQIAAQRGVEIAPKSETWRQLGRALIQAMAAAKNLPLPDALVNVANVQRELGEKTEALAPFVPQSTPPGGEAFSEALAAHVGDLAHAGVATTTLSEYRQRGSAFVAFTRDALIKAVTRAMASDFLDDLVRRRGVGNRTRNQYALFLGSVFDCARRRGRFEGNNPFGDQALKAEVKSYVPFTPEELNQLFASAEFETKPKEYGTGSALPWVAAIALYSGCRLEEIAQLRRGDLYEVDDILCLYITPQAGRLKNKWSHRYVPIHSALVDAGLLRYRDALPLNTMRLFPNLPARKSKGNKVGSAVGESFERWRKRLGLVREGLAFHSLRHNVAETLDRAAVAQSDVARLLGHSVRGVTFGVYSGGPGLVRLRETVEKIVYPGLRLIP
jgi:integrase